MFIGNVHVRLLLFLDDLVLTLESEVGLKQQLDMLQQLCVERGFIVNVEKKKSWCPTLLTHAKSLCLR
jgi:hypothetical protein